MHITKIDIGWLPPLEDIVFRFDKQVNLFIGPNASGKSTILRAIKMMHSFAIGEATPPIIHRDPGGIANIPAHEADVGELYLNYATVNDERPLIIMETSHDWPRDASGAKWDAVPFLYIPAARVNLPGMDVFGQTIEKTQDADIGTPPKQLFGIYSNVFNARELGQVIDWFRSKGDNRLRRSLQMALQLGHSCARGICPEVIHDYAPYPYVEEIDYGPFMNETIVYHDMGIGTSDSSVSGPLYVGALSSGTQGTLLWIWALTIKMASHYQWVEGWEKKPAILLIDEIENHLHPTWQRRVIPALLEHFPGLQIFATTHSPFVVAGLKARQVHLLKRGESGVVTATPNAEDVVGWTADEILRNMMGVDDPTDDETAAAARELRQLRNEEPRSETEEEAARQQRMQELRQRVDRDLLAGGPWKKQRELFEEQFSEALQKYRESKDMNQENG